MATRLEQAKRLIEKTLEENKNINAGKVGNPYGVKNAETLLQWFAEYVENNQREVLDSDGKKVSIDAPLTIEGFCLWCGHSERWIDSMIANIKGKSEAQRKKGEDELLRSATRVRDFCRNDLRTGAAQGAYQQNIVARILGLTDKQQVEQNINVAEMTLDEAVAYRKKLDAEYGVQRD